MSALQRLVSRSVRAHRSVTAVQSRGFAAAAHDSGHEWHADPDLELQPKVSDGSYNINGTRPMLPLQIQDTQVLQYTDNLPESFYSKWKPMILGFGSVPLLAEMVYDSRLAYLGSFFGLLGLADKFLSPQISSFLASGIEEQRQAAYAWKATEEDKCATILTTLEFKTSVTDDMKALNAYADEMLGKVREAKKRQVLADLQAQAVQHLLLLQKFEDQKLGALQAQVVAQATAKVRETFVQGDAKAKQQALQRALDLLSKSPAPAADPVQGLYRQFFQDYKKQAAAASNKAMTPEEMEIMGAFLNTVKSRNKITDDQLQSA